MNEVGVNCATISFQLSFLVVEQENRNKYEPLKTWSAAMFRNP
jgi:hypothetical protein